MVNVELRAATRRPLVRRASDREARGVRCGEEVDNHTQAEDCGGDLRTRPTVFVGDKTAAAGAEQYDRGADAQQYKYVLFHDPNPPEYDINPLGPW